MARINASATPVVLLQFAQRQFRSRSRFRRRARRSQLHDPYVLRNTVERAWVTVRIDRPDRASLCAEAKSRSNTCRVGFQLAPEGDNLAIGCLLLVEGVGRSVCRW